MSGMLLCHEDEPINTDFQSPMFPSLQAPQSCRSFQEYILGLCNHILNFKWLEKMFLFQRWVKSLVRFIKQKTFNIIQYAGFVAQQQRLAPFTFLCYQVQAKATRFSSILSFLFFCFSPVITLGICKTCFTSTYSSRNSDKGFPALLKSHPQRERASFLWMIKVV